MQKPQTLMLGNQLSRYGAISRSVGTVAPNAKYHFVGAATLPNVTDLLDEFGVDSDGQNRIYPTLVAAIADSAVVAARGDVLFVLPGHTETITGAAGIAVSKSGLSIVGLGNGLLRPTISFTTAIGAQMTVAGANVSFQNIVFSVGFDAITAMIAVTATDVSFINCEFNTNNATMGVVVGLSFGTTSNRFIVDGCRFLGPAVNSGTTTTAQIQYEAAVDGVIKNSYFTGKMTQAILNTTGAVLRGLIDNNRFVVATGTVAITVHSSSTPFITNNRINVPSGTAPIVAAAGFVAGNVYSAAAGVTAGTASTI